MRQYRKYLTLTAIAATAVLTGCASRQPAPTNVVVVPSTQAAPASQAAAAIRNGTVAAIQNTMASAGSQSSGSSGGTMSSGAAATGQLLTIQFDDGQRQFFQIAPGGQQFQIGDRVTVNATQSMPVITKSAN